MATSGIGPRGLSSYPTLPHETSAQTPPNLDEAVSHLGNTLKGIQERRSDEELKVLWQKFESSFKPELEKLKASHPPIPYGEDPQAAIIQAMEREFKKIDPTANNFSDNLLDCLRNIQVGIRDIGSAMMQ